jgi:hypothetical protein
MPPYEIEIINNNDNVNPHDGDPHDGEVEVLGEPNGFVNGHIEIKAEPDEDIIRDPSSLPLSMPYGLKFLPWPTWMIPIPKLNTGLHVMISSSSIVKEEDEGHDTTNQFLYGVMLTVKMADKPIFVYNNKNSGPASGASKGQKTGHNGGKPYDRLVTFADITSKNGGCFALLLSRKENSHYFFNIGHDHHHGVGDSFLIGEPKPTKDRLGGKNAMQLIQGHSGPVFPSDRGYMLLPRCVLATAPKPGATKYFCYHNVKGLTITNIMVLNAGCSGQLCDRQVTPPASATTTQFRCGCQHLDPRAGKVFDWSVTIPCSAAYRPGRKTTVHHFRSLRTSKVFATMAALEKYDDTDLTARENLRRGIKAMLDFIDHNGGWSVIGWIRTGEKQDDSDPKEALVENMASLNQLPHITYLMPSLSQLKFDGDRQYESHRFGTPDANVYYESDHSGTEAASDTDDGSWVS